MKPYGESGDKRDQVRDMFDHIAPGYDVLNRILSLGIDNCWRRRLVGRLAADGPARVLDMASGTGDLAVMIAGRIPGASVTAADLSEGMLAVAREKIRGRECEGRITTVVTEAERTPFGDGEFDAVAAAFGVRNFYDMEAGLREMYRVLGPGGTVYILEFQPPGGKVFGRLFRFYFHRVLPVVGGWFSGDRRAYTYLPRSVDEFPAATVFAQMMRESGFEDVTAHPMTGGVAWLYRGVKRSV